MKYQKKIIIPIATFFVFVLGAGMFMTTTFAQESTQGSSLLDKVANILNIERAEIEDAFTEAAIEEVNERVEAGNLDQEKADEIISRLEEDGFKFGRFGGEKRHKAGHLLETVSEYLGMEREEMIDAFKSGQTPIEIIEEAGKSVDEVKALLLEEIETHVNEKVEAGDMDQERADEILENAEERIDAFLAGERPERPERSEGQGRGFESPVTNTSVL